jgi:hypothetical protein
MEVNKVEITAIRVSTLDLCVLLVKLVVAAIPAAIILFMLGALFVGLFGGMFAAIGRG